MKTIMINSDKDISSNESIKIHLTYNDALTLKELSEALDMINKAINDVNRKNGVRSNVVLGHEFASRVSGVESGSIILNIITKFVANVAMSVFANYLYDRLKRIGSKKKKDHQEPDTGYPIAINVDGNNNTITINIDKTICNS